VREKRTVYEVMHDFCSEFKMPLAYLIQLAGRQKPREFSISSYCGLHPGEVHITMAVTEYET
jgi:sulfite reductase alpha subunit-like flavoprotein